MLFASSLSCSCCIVSWACWRLLTLRYYYTFLRSITWSNSSQTWVPPCHQYKNRTRGHINGYTGPHLWWHGTHLEKWCASLSVCLSLCICVCWHDSHDLKHDILQNGSAHFVRTNINFNHYWCKLHVSHDASMSCDVLLYIFDLLCKISLFRIIFY